MEGKQNEWVVLERVLVLLSELAGFLGTEPANDTERKYAAKCEAAVEEIKDILLKY